MSGWIKLNRSIQSHWIYNERRKFSKLEAWIDMIMTANYADNKVIIKGKLYEVKRGESINSMDTWASRWSWDKSAVRRFLTLLQNDNMISIKSDSITTHLTICKYESYQGERNADETQTKRKRNADETQTTPIKEGKEGEERKEDIDFKNEIFSYSDTYSKDMLEKFYLHWSEKNSKGKMKYELQPTWETKKRLSTWHSNSLKWEIKNPKLNHIDPKLESWFNSSISMIKQDLRTNKEHNDVVRQNKYDSKYLLPE